MISTMDLLAGWMDLYNANPDCFPIAGMIYAKHTGWKSGGFYVGYNDALAIITMALFKELRDYHAGQGWLLRLEYGIQDVIISRQGLKKEARGDYDFIAKAPTLAEAVLNAHITIKEAADADASPTTGAGS